MTIGKRLRICVLLGLCALSVGTASCHSRLDQGAVSSSGAGSTVATSAVPGATGGTVSPAPSSTEKLTGPAVAAFGQARVEAAYKAMVKFTFETGWSPRLILKHVDSITAADFVSVLPYMTPKCAKTFSASIAKAQQRDKDAIRRLEGAIFFGVKGPKGTTPIPSASMVTHRTYGQATVGIDKAHGVTRLGLAFTAKADIQMQDASGKHYVLPTSRTVHYLLVPNTGKDAKTKPFLIAAWKNTTTASPIQPAA